ncbi:MAG TPA: trypsin-like peptidase domain-containing protein [Thermoanaerobaculia bacterium]|nr:trypsin-like peptidase domain-containing protein [Thermoanaerobaculia bacterium]
MSRRSVALALLALLLAASCRKSTRLDDVGKMAYGVKPAVVRISAYATAKFHYPRVAIAEVAGELTANARNLAGEDLVVDTGAGGSGSGFVINPNGLILTSGHVVAPTRDGAALEHDLRRNGAIAALVKHFPIDELRNRHRGAGLDSLIDIVAKAGKLESVNVVDNVELSNGETLPFTIKSYSPELAQRGTDLAVVSVEHANLPTLPLGDSDTARVGDSIWAVGYPAVASSTDEVIGGWLSRDSDLEATFNPGTITAIKRNVNNTPVLQSNVAIYRGNSGGPAVDKDGDVIGISTWGHAEAEQIKFLVPINVAKAMLAAARIPTDADGEFNRYYRAALDAAHGGNWVVARRNLDVAARLFANSPDVIRFSGDVDRALRETPFWLLHPIATSVVAVIVVLFLILGFVAVRGNRVPADLLKVKTLETVIPTGRDEEMTLARHLLGKFTILNGARAGEKLGLGGSGIRIGRERTICEIVLENPKVSRLHAEVVSIDGKVLLIDRNSSNGTYVNDQKIDKRFLRDGDIIYFGGRNAVAVAFHA